MPKNITSSGFSLIEIMVVVGILAITFGTGIAAYNRFNNKQALIRAAQGLTTELRNTQKRADSGDRPAGGCNTLDGYQVTFGTNDVTLEALCNGNVTFGANTWALNQGSLTGLSIVTPLPPPFNFLPLSQGILPSSEVTVTISHSGIPDTATITISPAGAISCAVGGQSC